MYKTLSLVFRGSPFPLTTEDDFDEEDIGDEDEESVGSMDNDLDLPDVDDLDDDLGDDFQYEGDMPTVEVSGFSLSVLNFILIEFAIISSMDVK